MALRVVDHISAMVAYWDSNQRCVFANAAYREWFGRDPRTMVGISMQELLGPLYALNLPYIERALNGERQVFERRIPLPGGGARDSIATYTPDILDGVVRGFSVHVADVSALRERETELRSIIAERDRALAEVSVLRGLLPICAGCKDIRTEAGEWHSVEHYVSQRTEVRFSHGLCPKCVKKHYPDIKL